MEDSCRGRAGQTGQAGGEHRRENTAQTSGQWDRGTLKGNMQPRVVRMGRAGHRGEHIREGLGRITMRPIREALKS